MRPVKRLGAICARHQLLLELIHKDFDVRYAGSFLGVVWTQLYPLMLLGVYWFVFSIIFTNTIPDFPLFLFVGIALWSFFRDAILLATGSVLANAALITRVGFPRELVTISVVLVAFVDLLLSQVILLVGAIAYQVPPAWTWLTLPGLIALFMVFCVGIGLVLASAAVYLRDVRFFTEVSMLLLMFLTPVFYRPDSVPPQYHWLLTLNPLSTLISAYRDAFLNGAWPAASTWIALAAVAAIALWVGLEVFDRSQRGFPDAL